MGAFSIAVGTGGNGALPGGALFLWRNRGKNTKGKEVPSPWNPILWWEEWGKVVPSGRGLACGLQDQRLMARPPARAGGRSGLLTGGESGKPNGYFLPSPKGYLPTSPARPAGGRAVTSVTKRGPQAGYPTRSTAFPHTTPPEKGVQREEPLPSGVLSPISSQEMGPRLGKPPFPAVPTAWANPHNLPAGQAIHIPRSYTWQTYCVTAKKIYALSNFFYPFSPFIIFHKEKEMERFR